MTSGGRESQLEKLIVDFVHQKTMHRVRLHLADDITVRPVNIPPTGIDHTWIQSCRQTMPQDSTYT